MTTAAAAAETTHDVTELKALHSQRVVGFAEARVGGHQAGLLRGQRGHFRLQVPHPHQGFVQRDALVGQGLGVGPVHQQRVHAVLQRGRPVFVELHLLLQARHFQL